MVFISLTSVHHVARVDTSKSLAAGPEQLQDVCTNGKETSAGTDVWSPADFTKLPKVAYDGLAVMLNMIEDGAEWPKGTLFGKASFLSKANSTIGKVPNYDPKNDFNVIRKLFQSRHQVLYSRYMQS